MKVSNIDQYFSFSITILLLELNFLALLFYTICNFLVNITLTLLMLWIVLNHGPVFLHFLARGTEASIARGKTKISIDATQRIVGRMSEPSGPCNARNMTTSRSRDATLNGRQLTTDTFQVRCWLHRWCLLAGWWTSLLVFLCWLVGTGFLFVEEYEGFVNKRLRKFDCFWYGSIALCQHFQLQFSFDLNMLLIYCNKLLSLKARCNRHIVLL